MGVPKRSKKMKQLNIKPELNIQSYDDIITKIEECRKEHQELSERYNSIKLNCFQAIFDTTGRAEKQEDLKRQLKYLKDKLSYLDEILAELTTFDANILIPFLMEYLAQNTFERFLTLELEKTVPSGRSYSRYYYYIICNLEDVLQLRCSDYNPDACFDYDIKDHLTHNYICLYKEDKYALMNANGLKGDFKTFPELENAVRNIVNFRLENPRLDDETCLNHVLNGLRNNEATNKEAKPFNKTMLNGQKIKQMTLQKLFGSQRR